MADNTFHYYGIGLLSNQKLAGALLGRDLKNLRPTQVDGFELVVLNRDELPPEIQADTPAGFRMYALDFADRGSQVTALDLEVNPEEYAAIKALNFGDALYRTGLLTFTDGRLALIDHLPREYRNRGITVPGLNYNPFLNDRRTAFAVARGLRGQYLGPAEQKEGLIGRLSTAMEKR